MQLAGRSWGEGARGLFGFEDGYPLGRIVTQRPRIDPGMTDHDTNSGSHIPALLRKFERHGFRHVYSPHDRTWQRKYFKNLSKEDICREIRIPCTPHNFQAIQNFWKHSRHSWLSLHPEERNHPPDARAARAARPGKKEKKPGKKSHKGAARAKGRPLQPQTVNPSPLAALSDPPLQKQAHPRKTRSLSPPREQVGPSSFDHAQPAPWAPQGLDWGGYPWLPPLAAHHEFPDARRAYPDPTPFMSIPPYASYGYSRPQAYGLGHNPYHVSNRHAKKRDRDEIREQSVALSKAREDVEKEIDLMLEKQKTMSKVQKLKDRLRDKTASLPTASSDLNHEPEEANVPSSRDDVAHGPGSNWHLNADIQLSSEDYRLVGAGVVPTTTSDVPDPVLENPTSVAIYSKTTEESDKTIGEANPQPRIANAPQWKEVGWWQERARKARLVSETREIEGSHIPIRKRLTTFSPAEHPPPTRAMSDEDRSKYESMVWRLKQTMVKSKQSDLSEFVDCPTSMKRVLMSKLFNEHRSSISQRLGKLRFNGKTYQSDNDLELIKDLEETALELEEVDLEALPDSFVQQIEQFIIQEKFAESQPEATANNRDNLEEPDEEIVEVPIPPKPPVLLIDLDTDAVAPSPNQVNIRREGESIKTSGYCSQEKQRDVTVPKGNEQNSGVSPQISMNANSPLDDLLRIHLEEETLLLQNRRLCDELRKNNDQLQYLRELRMIRLASERN